MQLRVTLFCVLAGLSQALCAAPGRFSVQGLAGWEMQDFRGRDATRYELVQDAEVGVQVLQARCARSASGYIWKERVDLRQTPLLNWRWRVDQVYAGLHERDKRGDDFPARVYVVRDGGWAPWRTLSLVYVWSNGETPATDWPDPYTRQAHVVALRTGTSATGRWQGERRDVRADFLRYFGVEVDEIDAVALMSDCDDAAGEGAARYGDLSFTR